MRSALSTARSFAFALVATVSVAPAAHPQLVTTRGLLLAAPRDSGVHRALLPRADLWLEFQHNPTSDAGAMAWNYKIGTRIDLVRFGDRLAIEGVAANELYATPDNKIHFDPAGAIWEERLSVRLRTGGALWTAGVFQRCRHEVDNGTPRYEVMDSLQVVPTARVLVLPGFRLTATSGEITAHRLSVRGEAALEHFHHPTDDRTPAFDIVPDWRDARELVSITARARFALDAKRLVYGRYWHAATRFDGAAERSTWHASQRAELGLYSSGIAGGVSAFWAYERQFDDAMLPVPRPFAGAFFGLRLGSANLF